MRHTDKKSTCIDRSGLILNRYEGEFANNLKHGFGVYEWSDGTKYEGNFVEDRKDGFGTYYFYNGDKYAGNFKEDRFHGNGTYMVGLSFYLLLVVELSLFVSKMSICTFFLSLSITHTNSLSVSLSQTLFLSLAHRLEFFPRGPQTHLQAIVQIFPTLKKYFDI